MSDTPRVRNNELKKLQDILSNFDTIDAHYANADDLEAEAVALENKAANEKKELRATYKRIIEEGIKNTDPVKEAEAKIERVPSKTVKKKRSGHLLLVVAIAVVWVVASLILMNYELMPGANMTNLILLVVPRILYILGLIIALANYRKKELQKVGSACLLFVIPAVLAAILILTYYSDSSWMFGDTTALIISDLLLGGGSMALAFLGPNPNKALYKAIAEEEKKLKKRLASLNADTDKAISEDTYEKHKAVVAVKQKYALMRKQILELWQKAIAEQNKVAEIAAAAGISSSKNLNRAAVDYMISSIERERADTVAEAEENWEKELARKAAEAEKLNDLMRTEVDRAGQRYDRERERRRRLEEAENNYKIERIIKGAIDIVKDKR